MDEGLALPCYQRETVMIMSGKDSSLLCPQFVPDELSLNLQVHGNRNSMMQNITYNPIDQDPLLFFFLTATTSSQTIGAYCFEGLISQRFPQK